MVLTAAVIATAVKAQEGYYMGNPDGFIFVPPGTMQIDETLLDIKAFFISETEVTNGQYKVFLDNLKQCRDTARLAIAKVRDETWGTVSTANEKEYAAWSNLPVVNITREAANLYCQWLGKMLTLKGDGNNYAVSLPGKFEWEWAAGGRIEGVVYPWKGSSLKDAKGNYLAYFKGNATQAGPCKVKQFPDNGFKIYDMAGNVAEMIDSLDIVKGGSWSSEAAELRIDSDMPYQPGPTVGFRPIVPFDGVPKIDASCELWTAKNYCDLPDSLNTCFELYAEDLYWNTLKCGEMDVTKNWHGVHVRISCPLLTVMGLGSKLENISLKKKSGSQLLHPCAMLWCDVDFDKDQKGIPSVGYLTDHFKAKRCNLLLQPNRYYDLILYFSDAEIGDVISINHSIIAEIK
jgi:hypothetical protein